MLKYSRAAFERIQRDALVVEVVNWSLVIVAAEFRVPLAQANVPTSMSTVPG